MSVKVLKPADEAYQFPLLIKQLLLSSERYAGDNEIVGGLSLIHI